MSGTRKPQKVTGNTILRCSFCRKTQRQVRKLIASPIGNKAKTYICDQCVRAFQNAVDGTKQGTGSKSKA
jgi:ATP-dependent protease Clp ATPase subunit